MRSETYMSKINLQRGKLTEPTLVVGQATYRIVVHIFVTDEVRSFKFGIYGVEFAISSAEAVHSNARAPAYARYHGNRSPGGVGDTAAAGTVHALLQNQHSISGRRTYDDLSLIHI